MPIDDVTTDSLTEVATPSHAIVLVIAERARRNGKYTGHCDGQLIVDGVEEPFLDAARVLLAQGLNSNARYVIMRRSPDGPDALVSTLGKAAKLTVEARNDGVPIFRS